MFMHVTTIVIKKYAALCFNSFRQLSAENVCKYLRRFCSRHWNETFAYAMAAKNVRKPWGHLRSTWIVFVTIIFYWFIIMEVFFVYFECDFLRMKRKRWEEFCIWLFTNIFLCRNMSECCKFLNLVEQVMAQASAFQWKPQPNRKNTTSTQP